MGINGYQGNFTFEYGCRKYVCIFRDMFMLPAYIKYNKRKFDSPGKKSKTVLPSDGNDAEEADDTVPQAARFSSYGVNCPRSRLMFTGIG